MSGEKENFRRTLTFRQRIEFLCRTFCQISSRWTFCPARSYPFAGHLKFLPDMSGETGGFHVPCYRVDHHFMCINGGRVIKLTFNGSLKLILKKHHIKFSRLHTPLIPAHNSVRKRWLLGLKRNIFLLPGSNRYFFILNFYFGSVTTLSGKDYCCHWRKFVK